MVLFGAFFLRGKSLLTCSVLLPITRTLGDCKLGSEEQPPVAAAEELGGLGLCSRTPPP